PPASRREPGGPIRPVPPRVPPRRGADQFDSGEAPGRLSGRAAAEVYRSTASKRGTSAPSRPATPRRPNLPPLVPVNPMNRRAPLGPPPKRTNLTDSPQLAERPLEMRSSEIRTAALPGIANAMYGWDDGFAPAVTLEFRFWSQKERPWKPE